MQAKSSHTFKSTHWSVVLAAADRSSPECEDALATLCVTYWYPIYAFIRRQGASVHEAEDLTQAFFVRLLERDFLDNVGPEKGRFRTFLLVCLRRFLANERDRRSAKKRGGGRRPVSIDFAAADRRYRQEPFHELTAERVFQRRWTLALLERVVGLLAEEFRQSGKAALFDGLKVYLVAEQRMPPYAETAEKLGTSEGAVKVAVYRLRERFRRTLRAEVARTLDNPDDVDDEIRRLFEVLRV
ncbi:MAG: RNA polymerase sigma factor [Planctomycetota bacterium]|jgi:RNA polymerase sigma-70 factor (ECF subfamily)